ncbi:MAG: L-aspartate oxidase [Marinifilaceae bacterium]
MLHEKFDFLIIGSGLAGLYSANYAAQFGRVALLTKSGIDVSNSYFAQGGIAAVTDSEDFPQYHLDDTILAGRGLCDHTPVNILVNEGPVRIQELIDLGMQFDTENGELALGLEGGHHKRRVLHAGGDSTGKEVSTFLIRKVKEHPNISIYENHMIFDLLVEDGICYGSRSWDTQKQEEFLVTAPSTILAMGGASGIYSRTTNPETSVGDGIALGYNAGVQVADLEFIQFHPSSFYSETGETFLISEAVRGEGAHLINHKGERFMENLHELAELAPRDVVARSIFAQMQNNNESHVFLKLSHLDGEKIKKRFPTIYQKCKNFGVDMCQQIPVAPAAHYMVGGLRTGVFGETNINNLYACGELASTGVMGANRLASNSLLECLVFGKRAIDHARNKRDISHQPTFPKSSFKSNSSLSDTFLDYNNQIAAIMTQKVGIVREEKELKKALELFTQLENKFPFEENEFFSLRLKNLLLVCRLITKAALAREESRGGHIRKEFDGENNHFLHHSIQQLGKKMYHTPVDTKQTN